MISAAFVTAIRIFSPLEVRWDLSIQLEAAYRLTQGLGLTNAFSSHFNLNQPPIAENLTHFPPGFSLLTAAFIFFNIPLAIALKSIYTFTTLLGWMGWSAVASRCLKSPLHVWSFAIPGHVLIAATLPLFFTPAWLDQGTDIFLWAGIPIASLLLLRSSDRQGWPVLTALAGFTVGLLVCFRYASVFVVIAAIAIVIYSEFPKISALVKRLSIFSASCALVLIPTFIYISRATRAISNVNAEISNKNLINTHGSRHSDLDLFSSIINSFLDIFYSLPNLYRLSGIPSSKIDLTIESRVEGSIWIWPVGLSLLGLVIWMSFTLIKDMLTREKRIDTISVVLMCLVSSFVLFSIALAFVVSYSPLAIKRYYLPLQPCIILLAYKTATHNVSHRRISNTCVKAFVVIAIATLIVYKPTQFLVNQSKQVNAFLGDSNTVQLGDRFPSNKISTYHDKSIQFLQVLEWQNPNALFLIQHYPLYMSYLNFQNPLRFRRIPDNSFWENAYVSESSKVYWVVNKGQCPSICSSSGNFNSDNPEEPLLSLAPLPNTNVVFFNSSNSTTIFESDLPAGYIFTRN